LICVLSNLSTITQIPSYVLRHSACIRSDCTLYCMVTAHCWLIGWRIRLLHDFYLLHLIGRWRTNSVFFEPTACLQTLKHLLVSWHLFSHVIHLIFAFEDFLLLHCQRVILLSWQIYRIDIVISLQPPLMQLIPQGSLGSLGWISDITQLLTFHIPFLLELLRRKNGSGSGHGRRKHITSNLSRKQPLIISLNCVDLIPYLVRGSAPGIFSPIITNAFFDHI